jgi:hypothetical protein
MEVVGNLKWRTSYTYPFYTQTIKNLTSKFKNALKILEMTNAVYYKHAKSQYNLFCILDYTKKVIKSN